MGVELREDRFYGAQLTLSPTSVANATAAEQTFTLPGLKTTDVVLARKAANQAGLSIGSARASAADTVAINFINATAATITPTATEVYTFFVFRPELAGQLPGVIPA
jgi:hypothetical protein